MLRSEKARSDLFWEGTEGRRKTETKNAQEQYDLQVAIHQIRHRDEILEKRRVAENERLERKLLHADYLQWRNEEGKRKRDEIQARYNELKAARDRKA